MSRVTTRQSKANVFSDVNDENAMVQRSSMTRSKVSMAKRNSIGNTVMTSNGSLSGKTHGMGTRKKARAALNDISNKVKRSEGGDNITKKKQRLVQHQHQSQNAPSSFSSAPMSVTTLPIIPSASSTASSSNREPSKPTYSARNANAMMGGEDSDIALVPQKKEENRRTSLDAMVDDVEMAADEDTVGLEGSVGGLTINNSVDAADVNDPHSVTEYVMDIMNYFKKTEARRQPSPTYMSKQSDINEKMREILIDWLVEVHLKFKLKPETLYLTVNIIDRFLERRAVSRTKLQLVGCTAMLIASKYEEIYSPEVRDFVYISDKAYTREQILAMESIMLSTLNFNVTVPSALRFGQRFGKVARADTRLKFLISFLMELTLQDSKFLKYLPSSTASAAVYLALRMTGQQSPWTADLQAHTSYAEADIKQCIVDMHHIAAKESSKYRAVKKKYSSRKYGEVAKIPVGACP